MEPKHGRIPPAPPLVDLELAPRPNVLITGLRLSGQLWFACRLLGVDPSSCKHYRPFL